MRTLLQEANGRGTLTDIDWSTFSNTEDSNGVAWSKEITLKIAPGTNYLDVAKSLVSNHMCEFRMVGRSLRLFEYGTMGIDRTVGAIGDQVVIRKGRDITDSPRKRTVRKAATDILLAGGEGLYRVVSDETARARRGRQVEQYRSQGSITDEGTLLAYGAIELERAKSGTTSITHGLTFEDPATPVPLRDFREGDWVWSDTGQPGGPERLQVAQVVLEGDSSGIRKGSATLNDLIASREAQLAQRVKGIEGGSTLTGTSQARPVDEGPDTTVPAAPEGLVLSSSAYLAGGGTTEAQIGAQWADVTTNTDATAIDDLAGYAVRFRYLSDQDLPTDWQPAVETAGTSPSLTFSPFVPGVDVEAQVQAFDRTGNRSDWSASAFVETANDTTPPPVPSTPEAGSIAGVYTLTWDGRGSLGETMGVDFRAAEWHASTTSGFTADRPIGPDGKVDLSVSTTYRGEFRGGNVLALRTGEPGIVEGAELFSCLVAVDQAGNASEQSGETSAVPGLLEEGDIASVNIGVLTSGIMNAVLTIANTIQTSDTGSRVVIDTSGFRCVNDADEEVLSYSITQELLTMIGKFLTSADDGARIEIDPVGPDGFPTMLLYSENGIYSAARLNAFDISGGKTGLGINSAYDSNSTTAPYSRAILRPTQAALEVIRKSDEKNIGGLAFANGTGAGLEAYSTSATRQASAYVNADGSASLSGANDAYVSLESDGDVQIGAGSGREIRFTQPIGTGGGGLSFRAQGGNNGGYRTYTGGLDFLSFVENQSGARVKLGDDGGAYKNFVIPHPLDDARWLVHGCTESPHGGGVEYWGETVVNGGLAQVELPAYFEALTEQDDRQVQVTPIIDGPLRVPVLAAATPIRNGRFTVHAPHAPDGSRVAWLVKAVRRGTPMDVEPLRHDVEVAGFGPYRTINRKRPSA
jgi:hypothetical protein